MTSSTTVVVSNVTLTLDQLIDAVRQLDEPGLNQVAQALLEVDSNIKLAELIRRLAEREPAGDVSDEAIRAEIVAVRQSRAQRHHAESRH
ncbi:MAG: mediator of RNA polymerase II transcription subunit 17 [Chloroflexi bacterium]|nr:mediator of RNA polymerase II transcription subunit 17 [Chloroflexota bacterium]